MIITNYWHRYLYKLLKISFTNCKPIDVHCIFFKISLPIPIVEFNFFISVSKMRILTFSITSKDQKVGSFCNWKKIFCYRVRHGRLHGQTDSDAKKSLSDLAEGCRREEGRSGRQRASSTPSGHATPGWTPSRPQQRRNVKSTLKAFSEL